MCEPMLINSNHFVQKNGAFKLSIVKDVTGILFFIIFSALLITFFDLIDLISFNV